MDVLCTDKTGMLTQDKIVLERHTNVFGANSEGAAIRFSQQPLFALMWWVFQAHALALPLPYFGYLVALLLGYATLTTVLKRDYLRRFGWQ